MIQRWLSIIMIFVASMFWIPQAFALRIYYRQEAIRLGQQKPYQFNRFNYLHGNTLPQAKKDRSCVQMGQARCLGFTKPHPNMPHVRYSNRIAEQNQVHPYLRIRYPYKIQQNF